MSHLCSAHFFAICKERERTVASLLFAHHEGSDLIRSILERESNKSEGDKRNQNQKNPQNKRKRMFGDRASKLALTVLDDGDDLHITRSFCPGEENSSTAGNLSVMMPQQSILPSSWNAKSSTDSDNDSVSAEQSDSDSEEETRQPPKRAILKHIPSLAKRSFSHPRKLSRKFSSMLSRQWSLRTMEDYQEFGQNDPTTTDGSSASWIDDSSIAHSIRSSRINVATGRTMLIRQKAQVFGRPSAAHTDWDLASLSSRASSSGNNSSSRSRRSISFEAYNSSGRSVESDMSHLTTDSFRSKRSRMSRAMYVTPSGNNSLLGESESETSDNDLDDLTNSTILSGSGIDDNCASVARKWNSLETVQEESDFIWDDHTHLPAIVEKRISRMSNEGSNAGASARRQNKTFATGTEKWEMLSSLSTSPSIRRSRFCSDSDIVFEVRRGEQNLFDFSESGDRAGDPDIDSLFGAELDDDIESSEGNGRMEARFRTFSDSFINPRTDYWDDDEGPPSIERQEISSGQTWENFTSLSSDVWSDSPPMEDSSRQRFFSESDIVFESRRNINFNYGLDEMKPPESRVSSGSASLAEDIDSEPSEKNKAMTRFRTHSDSDIYTSTSSSEGDEDVFPSLKRQSTTVGSRRRLMSDPQFDSSFSFANRGTFTGQEHLSSSGSELSGTSGTPLLLTASHERNPVFEPLTRRVETSPESKSDASMTGNSGSGGSSKSDEENAPIQIHRRESQSARHQIRDRLHSDTDIAFLANAMQRMETSTPNWHSKSHQTPAGTPLSRRQCSNGRRLSLMNEHYDEKSRLSPPLPSQGNNWPQKQPRGDDDQDRSPLKPLSSRLSSPLAATAAKMIASNLRRSSAPLPSRHKKTHNYYWNDEESDGDDAPKTNVVEEALGSFSFESYDDIL